MIVAGVSVLLGSELVSASQHQWEAEELAGDIFSAMCRASRP
jgi:hypothetical protein